MKEQLDRYIRSLAERELKDEAPEFQQDLGTFVCWLLEKLGYEILLRPYKRAGLERRKSAGRRQWGVDILASKADADGNDRLYRFVLKEGSIGPAQWQPEVPGSMVHDLCLAADRHPVQHDGWHVLDGSKFKRFTVVAVHNGDFDTEVLGGHFKQLRTRLRRKRIELEWWNADRLVEFALGPPDGATSSKESGLDASLYPPGVRPLVRAGLDSLRTNNFDLDAIDRLVEVLLPLNRSPTGDRGRVLSGGPPMDVLRLERALGELALYARMLAVEARQSADDTAVPVLDAIERMILRGFEHARRVPAQKLRKHRRRIEKNLWSLLLQYVEAAERLAEHLHVIDQVPCGLVINSEGEQLDYPTRVLRFSCYLATAGLVLLDYASPLCDRARRIANILWAIWRTNEGGWGMPITDDQIIELAIVWEFFMRCGHENDVPRSASAVCRRMILRRQMNLPLPGLYQSARNPMAYEDIETLAEAYARGRDVPPAFEDSGSTILPLALYLADQEAFDECAPFFLAKAKKGTEHDVEERETAKPPVFLQVWCPPDDAAHEWYARGIKHRGYVAPFMPHECTVETFLDAFERVSNELPASPAERWEMPSVDRIAWKTWRTPPPMNMLIATRRRVFPRALHESRARLSFT